MDRLNVGGLIAMLVALASCSAPAPEGPVACSERQDGAIVTIGTTRDNPRDRVALWITDAAFINQALADLAAGDGRPSHHPMFGRVLDGRDCDAERAWHVEPASASWTEMSTEECDATAEFVSANLASWIARPTPNWCPWHGRVLSVDDRRP